MKHSKKKHQHVQRLFQSNSCRNRQHFPNAHEAPTVTTSRAYIRNDEANKCSAYNISICTHVQATWLQQNAISTNGVHSTDAQQTRHPKDLGQPCHRWVLCQNMQGTRQILVKKHKKHPKYLHGIFEYKYIIMQEISKADAIVTTAHNLAKVRQGEMTTNIGKPSTQQLTILVKILQ